MCSGPCMGELCLTSRPYWLATINSKVSPKLVLRKGTLQANPCHSCKASLPEEAVARITRVTHCDVLKTALAKQAEHSAGLVGLVGLVGTTARTPCFTFGNLKRCCAAGCCRMLQDAARMLQGCCKDAAGPCHHGSAAPAHF